MWSKIKDFVKKHPKKISVAVGTVVGGAIAGTPWQEIAQVVASIFAGN